jgi:hypothetical protein
MSLIIVRRLGALAPVLAALTIVVGSAQFTSAATCMQDFGSCSAQAAGIDGFWARAAAGFDCEWTYGQCVLQGSEF